ncbi:TIR domain-containing protein [Streptomyces rubrogriseus]|uniref:TIR domain-containing protein n=1 Tax=Streptomyces rubrogriseus TaxID=194673 RepID=A0A6G3TL42_9ACTN|nr:TIR domain-containing protein [Streptomyces rubrogriseus]NEC37175.1 TIR domain-containing protein [Streptomyces rubrogriseus]
MGRSRLPADRLMRTRWSPRGRGLGSASARLRSAVAGRGTVRAELGYGAFLSYSGERDRRWLPQLRHAIEKQSRPWYKPPYIRVFLDKTGVSIGPELWGKIEAGLARSDWLVVLASPEARSSVWVDREIAWWLEHKSVHTILLVVTAGQLVWDERRGDWDPERSTALPARLAGKFERQPVWKSVDPRPDGDAGFSPDDAGFSPDVDGVAFGVASVVRGLPEDELRSEGLRDTRRNLRTARIVAAALGCLLLVASTLSVVAVLSRAEATRQRDQAVVQQLITQSSLLAERDPFAARLKALAAWRIDPSPETRFAVLDAAVDPASGVLSHSVPVDSVAFSPDGRTVASGGSDGVVRIWRTGTQRTAGRPLIGHHQGVTSIAFAPDGRTLASSGFDGTVRLWHLADRTQIGAPFNAGAGTVRSVVFGRDGRTLVTVDEADSGTVRVWDVATHRQTGHLLHGPGSVLGTNADGSRVGSSTSQGGIRLWDTESGAPAGAALKGGDGVVTALSFSPDGKTFATADLAGNLRLWDIGARAPVGEPIAAPSTSTGARSITFSPDGAMLAAAYEDGGVRLWDLRRRAQVGGPLLAHTSTVESVAFSPDGSVLASASADTTVRLWDVRTLRQAGAPIDTGGTGAAALSPDGRSLAVVDSEQAVRLWNVVARRRVGEPLVRGVDSFSPSLAFRADGAVLAIGSDGLRLREVATRRPVGEPLLGTGDVGALSFGSDGRTLVSGGPDSVHVWDLTARPPTGTALGPGSVGVALSPDGRSLATTTQDDTVVFWDMATRRRTGETPGDHTAQITAVAWSPDGTTLATAGRDDTVRLWDAATRERIGAPLRGHHGGVTSVVFSPDGRTLATGGNDGTVRLWDVAMERPIGAPLEGHGAGVTGTAFTPGGDTLVSWAQDGTARLWNVEATADPVRSLCAWADGAFTTDRWHEDVPPGPASRTLCPE